MATIRSIIKGLFSMFGKVLFALISFLVIVFLFSLLFIGIGLGIGMGITAFPIPKGWVFMSDTPASFVIRYMVKLLGFGPPGGAPTMDRVMAVPLVVE